MRKRAEYLYLDYAKKPKWGIMFAKGRVERPQRHLPSLLGQMPLRPFDERSEPGKTKFFRVSALGVRRESRQSQANLEKRSFFRVSALGVCRESLTHPEPVEGDPENEVFSGLCPWSMQREPYSSGAGGGSLPLGRTPPYFYKLKNTKGY